MLRGKTMLRPFKPTGATQNSVMDGTAKTITIARQSDVNGSVNLTVVGTAIAFVTLDGTTPTTSNAKPLINNSDSTLEMPSGKLEVKLIGAAGSTVYVTPGRGY
jgi:hypothetical protein